jgi:hypothetical protein
MTEQSAYPPYIDRYDANVLDELEQGEVYSVTQIKRAYLRFTTISREDTAGERRESLLKSPAFEMERHGYFRYLGPKEPEGI